MAEHGITSGGLGERDTAPHDVERGDDARAARDAHRDRRAREGGARVDALPTENDRTLNETAAAGEREWLPDNPPPPRSPDAPPATTPVVMDVRSPEEGDLGLVVDDIEADVGTGGDDGYVYIENDERVSDEAAYVPPETAACRHPVRRRRGPGRRSAR